MFKTLATNEICMAISMLASILGFILSVAILFITRNLKKKLIYYNDIKNFNKNRLNFSRDLTAYRDLIIKNNLLDNKLISDIAKVINEYDNHKAVLNTRDKIEIFLINRLLNMPKEKINRQKLCLKLAYFISRCEKERMELL